MIVALNNSEDASRFGISPPVATEGPRRYALSRDMRIATASFRSGSGEEKQRDLNS